MERLYSILFPKRIMTSARAEIGPVRLIYVGQICTLGDLRLLGFSGGFRISAGVLAVSYYVDQPSNVAIFGHHMPSTGIQCFGSDAVIRMGGVDDNFCPWVL